MSILQSWFPHVKGPPIALAPMRTVSGPALTAAVTNAGGLGMNRHFLPHETSLTILGFLGAGWNFKDLPTLLQQTLNRLHPPPLPTSPLPVGLGVLTFNGNLDLVLASVVEFKVGALWLFGAKDPSELQTWIQRFKESCKWLKIFVQVGSPEEARAAVGFGADAIVIQGGVDAGGHGLLDERGSIVVLVPEVVEVLRAMGRSDVPVLGAGGITDGFGIAAALGAGADGAVIGSRFICSEESEAPAGLKQYIVSHKSGPRTSVRTRLYDNLRGTSFWPAQYGGRAIRNESMKEFEQGVTEEELKTKYEEAIAAEDWDRLTVFVGEYVVFLNEIRADGNRNWRWSNQFDQTCCSYPRAGPQRRPGSHNNTVTAARCILKSEEKEKQYHCLKENPGPMSLSEQ